MRNELQKHKKSDKIKWIATALAVIMLGVGAAIVTDCFGLLRQNTDNYIELPSDNDMVQVGEHDGITLFMGKAVAVAATNETSAYVSQTITAVVNPNTVLDNYVTWRLSWATGASLSNNAITDYVCLTDDSQGSLTATVNAYKSFRGSDIILTCASRQGNKTATCTITYDGVPSSVSIGKPANVGSYNLGAETVDLLYAGNTYTAALTMDNIFHDVGTSYNDFNVTVTGVGKIKTGTWIRGQRGAYWDFDQVFQETPIDNIKNDLIAVTVSGNRLSIQAKKTYMAYYSSTEDKLQEGTGTVTYYYDKYHSSLTDSDGNVPYFLVTVSHKTLGFSSTYKLLIGESVESVTLSNNVMKF